MCVIVTYSCSTKRKHDLFCQNCSHMLYTDRLISHYEPRSRLLNPPPAAQRHRHNLPSFRGERQIHCSDKSKCGACEVNEWISPLDFVFLPK